MTYDELIKYFKEENDNFSLTEFFTDNNSDLDKREILVITPNQIIKSRTLITEDNKGRSGHDLTYEYLTRILYNIGIDSDGKIIEDEEILKEYDYALTYLQYYQNILIRMCNEGVNHTKLIWVHIPPTITSKQLNMLESIEKDYGIIFKNVSKKMNKDNDDYLVGFTDSNDKTIKGDSLECVIKYIISNNLINDNEPKLDEEIIIDSNIKMM